MQNKLPPPVGRIGKKKCGVAKGAGIQKDNSAAVAGEKGARAQRRESTRARGREGEMLWWMLCRAWKRACASRCYVTEGSGEITTTYRSFGAAVWKAKRISREHV